MKIYIADINDVTINDLSRISNERAKKAKKYRYIDDQKRCIAGGLLIKKFLGGANLTNTESRLPKTEYALTFLTAADTFCLQFPTAKSDVILNK